MIVRAHSSEQDGSVGHKSMMNGSERVIWKELEKYFSSTKMSTQNGIPKHENPMGKAREKHLLRNSSAL